MSAKDAFDFMLGGGLDQSGSSAPAPSTIKTTVSPTVTSRDTTSRSSAPISFHPNVDRWEPIVNKYAAAYPDVPPVLVKSIIQQESAGNPNAVGVDTSWGKAKGLGQFIDATAKDYIPGWNKPEDSYDPEKNIAGIYSYLSDLKDRYGTWGKAIPYYYGKGKQPAGFPSWQGYVDSVLTMSGIDDPNERRVDSQESNSAPTGDKFSNMLGFIDQAYQSINTPEARFNAFNTSSGSPLAPEGWKSKPVETPFPDATLTPEEKSAIWGKQDEYKEQNPSVPMAPAVTPNQPGIPPVTSGYNPAAMVPDYAGKDYAQQSIAQVQNQFPETRGLPEEFSAASGAIAGLPPEKQADIVSALKDLGVQSKETTPQQIQDASMRIALLMKGVSNEQKDKVIESLPPWLKDITAENWKKAKASGVVGGKGFLSDVDRVGMKGIAAAQRQAVGAVKGAVDLSLGLAGYDGAQWTPTKFNGKPDPILENMLAAANVLDSPDIKRAQALNSINNLKKSQKSWVGKIGRQLEIGNYQMALPQMVADYAILENDPDKAKEAIAVYDKYKEAAAGVDAETRKENWLNRNIIFPAAQMMSGMVGTGVKAAIPVVGQWWSLSEWARQGAGDVYTDMVKSGVDHNTARGLAAVGGTLYAAVEKLQFGQLTRVGAATSKGVSLLSKVPKLGVIADKVIKNKIAAIALTKGTDWLKEVGEEGVQQFVTDVTTEIGRQLSDTPDKQTDVSNATKVMWGSVWDQLKGAAGPMGLLSLIGFGVGAGKHIAFGKKDGGAGSDIPPPSAEGPTAPPSTPQEPQQQFVPGEGEKTNQDLIQEALANTDEEGNPIAPSATPSNQPPAGVPTQETAEPQPQPVGAINGQEEGKALLNAVPPSAAPGGPTIEQAPPAVATPSSEINAQVENLKAKSSESKDVDAADEQAQTLTKVLSSDEDIVPPENDAEVLDQIKAYERYVDSDSGASQKTKSIVQKISKLTRDSLMGMPSRHMFINALNTLKKTNRNFSLGAIDLLNIGGLNNFFLGKTPDSNGEMYGQNWALKHTEFLTDSGKAIGGHEASNIVLSKIAQRIQKSLGEGSAQAYRTGGDEIMAIDLSRNSSELASALDVASKEVGDYIRLLGLDTIAHPKHDGMPTGGGTIDHGVVSVDPSKSISDMISEADALAEKNKEFNLESVAKLTLAPNGKQRYIGVEGFDSQNNRTTTVYKKNPEASDVVGSTEEPNRAGQPVGGRVLGGVGSEARPQEPAGANGVPGQDKAQQQQPPESKPTAAEPEAKPAAEGKAASAVNAAPSTGEKQAVVAAGNASFYGKTGVTFEGYQGEQFRVSPEIGKAMWEVVHNGTGKRIGRGLTKDAAVSMAGKYLTENGAPVVSKKSTEQNAPEKISPKVEEEAQEPTKTVAEEPKTVTPEPAPAKKELTDEEKAAAIRAAFEKRQAARAATEGKTSTQKIEEASQKQQDIAVKREEVKAERSDALDRAKAIADKLLKSIDRQTPGRLNSIGTEQAELAFELVGALVEAGHQTFKDIVLVAKEISVELSKRKAFRDAIEDAYDAYQEVTGELPARGEITADSVLGKPTDKEEGDQNAVDQTGEKSLGGVPTEDVQVPSKEGDTGRDVEKGKRGSRKSDRGPSKVGPESDRGAGDSSAQPDIPTTGVGSAGTGGGVPGASSTKSRPVKRGNVGGPDGDGNYRITDDDAIGEGGPKSKYRDNVAAIRLLKKIEKEERMATAEEQKVLVKYVGWGMLASPLDESYHKGWEEEYEELKELLTKEEYESAQRSSTNAHYTSPTVIRAMWGAVKRIGFKGGSVLEPGMGIGHFFGLRPTDVNMTMQGVELDETSGRIAQHLYQNADISVQGYETIDLAKDSISLAISNVPFEKATPFDKNAKKYGIKTDMPVHDFYFAKTLYGVKPGGVIAFITSRYTMDKNDTGLRRFMAERANVVGSIRLPNDAFKKNAGTEVVTDIIFLQKRKEGVEMDQQTKRFISTSLVERTNPENGYKEAVAINNYYVDNPSMVIGDHTLGGTMYKENEYTVEFGDTGDFPAALNAAMQNLPAGIMSEISDDGTNTAKSDLIDALSPENLHVGSYFFAEDGKLLQKQAEGKATEVTDLSKDQVARGRRMMKIRDLTKEVITLQAAHANTDDINLKIRDLNAEYDSFVKAYGFLHDKKNDGIIEDDPEWSLLLALENWDRSDKIATKSDLLLGNLIFGLPNPQTAETSADAMLVSLAQTGAIDWNWMSQATGKSIETLQEDLLADGSIFEDTTPFLSTSNVQDRSFVIADEYLSGNVKTKLQDAVSAASKDKRFESNVTALKTVQPADLTPSQVNIAINSALLTIDDMRDFASEVTDIGADNIFIGRADETGQISVSVGEKKYNYREGVEKKKKLKHYRFNTAKNTVQFGTERITAIKILESLLNSRDPIIMDRVNNKKSVVNKQDTEEARVKAAMIAEEFNRWIWNDGERADRIMKSYNDTFNNNVEREYIHPLLRKDKNAKIVLPGSTIPLRAHQANVAWRGIITKNVMMAHEVGSGKAGALDSLLLTPTGWIRMGDVKVGDYVIGQDGKKALVSGVFPQGEKEIFRVVMSDGSSAETCEEHLWKTWNYQERNMKRRAEALGKDWPSGYGKVRTLAEIRKTLVAKHLGAKNHSIPIVRPVEFEKRNLFIPPYVLGVILGDGSIGYNSISISKPDMFVFEKCKNLLGSTVSMSINADKKRCFTWRIVKNSSGTKNDYIQVLKEYGLMGKMSYDKFIPEDYLFSDIQDRVDLLNGLMDTDGYVEKRGYATLFTTTSHMLKSGIVSLVNSLGGTAAVTNKKPYYTYKGKRLEGAPAYVISIKLPPEINPFTLPRKRDAVIPKAKYGPVRYIVDVIPVGKKEAQCIMVENEDHLYVMDDFIVTHNTISITSTAMELKRLGLRNKSMVVVPNHMVEQWAHDVRVAYPGAKVLVATDRNFQPEKRKEFINRIATGNWDLVIVKQSNYKMIPVSHEYEKFYIGEKIAEYKEALAQLTGNDAEPKHLKKIQTRLKAYSAKLAKLSAMGKDVVTPFDKLGVDQLFIDEADTYKNVDFVTGMRNVSSLGKQEGTEHTTDMMMKVRFIQKRGGGVTFATGTPIANTMVEAYHMMKYLQPDVLRELKIRSFDAWASVFGKVIEAYEPSKTGEGFSLRTRFIKFVNVPELMTSLRRAWDIRTASMLEEAGILVPGVNLPVLKTHTVDLKKSDDLAGYVRHLVTREDLLKQPGADPHVDNSLVIVTDGRKSAIDLRLIDRDLPQNEDSKLRAAVKLIKRLYDEGTSEKLTGLVFYDLTRPGKKDAFDVQKHIRDSLEAEGIPRKDVAFIHEYDTDEKKQILFDAVNSGKVRVVIGSTSKMGAGTNMQKRLKWMIHIDAPWRPRDIAQRIGRMVRQGNVNADGTPRNVDNYVMVVKGTYDAALWYILAGKAKMIDQVMSGKDKTVREIEDDSGFENIALATIDDPETKEAMELKEKVRRAELEKRSHDDTVIEARRKLSSLPGYIGRLEEYIASAKKDLEEIKTAEEENNGISLDYGSEKFRLIVKEEKKPEVVLKEGEKKEANKPYDEQAEFKSGVKALYEKVVDELSIYVERELPAGGVISNTEDSIAITGYNHEKKIRGASVYGFDVSAKVTYVISKNNETGFVIAHPNYKIILSREGGLESYQISISDNVSSSSGQLHKFANGSDMNFTVDKSNENIEDAKKDIANYEKIAAKEYGKEEALVKMQNRYKQLVTMLATKPPAQRETQEEAKYWFGIEGKRHVHMEVEGEDGEIVVLDNQKREEIVAKDQYFWMDGNGVWRLAVDPVPFFPQKHPKHEFIVYKKDVKDAIYQVASVETGAGLGRTDSPSVKSAIDWTNGYLDNITPDVLDQEIAKVKDRVGPSPRDMQPPEVQSSRPYSSSNVRGKPISSTKAIDTALAFIPAGESEKIDVQIGDFYEYQGKKFPLSNKRNAVIISDANDDITHVYVWGGNDAESMARALNHEIVGHYGSKLLFRANPEYRARMLAYWEQYKKTPAYKDLMDNYIDDIYKLPESVREDYMFNEFVAANIEEHLANRTGGIAESIYNFFRNMMLKIGIAKEKIDDVLRAMVKDMRAANEGKIVENEEESGVAELSPAYLNVSQEDIDAANKTSRSMGAVGSKAITPRYVESIATTEDNILDFGAGKDAAHAKRLNGLGLNVTAYDFGNNVKDGIHNPDALSDKYDIVYASNVMNVQSGEDMARQTLEQIRDSVRDGGVAIFNYPTSPRYTGMSADDMKSVVVDIFGSGIVRVGGTRSAPLWEVSKGERKRPLKIDIEREISEGEKIEKACAG